ncbi:MAG: glycosyltransferase [Erysipelotrichaceae bacterium]|nr:glycosyltransferase [Erysipelotrichaceae bacterium]
MKISIITVCYNSEKTIEDTIHSVLAQTYKDYEYLIIDGASKDRTLEIVGKYLNDPRVRLVSEKDKGLYDAMNKGIALATGDVIANINSDDVLYDENVFQTVVDHFDDNTDIVYADVLYCDEKLEKTVRNYISGQKNSDAWCPAHPSMYVRRKVFEKLGNYNISYRICADYDFMVRCNINDINYRYVRQYFVKMRYGGASNGLKGYLKNFKECYVVLKKNGISFPLLHTVYRSLRTIVQLIMK